jgi:signal transduction histidine kinase/CheY-like chemotaxis protein/CHASE3 domain sensor protein
VFFGAAVALLAIAALSGAALRDYADATAEVDHTMQLRRETYEWLYALIDAETGVRGYVASNDPRFLEPYMEGLPRARAHAEALRALVGGEAEQLRLFDAVDQQARRAVTHLSDLVGLMKEGRRDVALISLVGGEGKRRMDAFREASAALREGETVPLHERQERARRSARLALGGSLALTAFASALLLTAWRRERAHHRRIVALAEEARGRLKSLSVVAVALAEARTRAQVAAVVVEHVVRATGADTCTLYELDRTGTTLELKADRGVVPEVLAKIRRLTEERDPTTFASMKEGRSLWAESHADYARIYPDLAGSPAKSGRRARAFWSVPLVAEGRTLGMLGVGYYEPRTFPADERDFIETLSRHCSEALLRAAHLEREDEARRWLMLSRAGEALVSSLDYEATLATVARLAVPALADWCAVDLLEPGGLTPRRVAVAHVDENKVRLAHELEERYPPDADATTGVPAVIRTGKSELYSEIPRELLDRAARDDEHRRLIHELRLESAMIVPLQVRGRTLGAISFVHADSGRRYGPADLSFAEDFARRAAMAIENSLANRAKDEFLATVSHELRTPLSAILGSASLLLRRQLPPELHKGIARIERNARLQAKLIEDVLDISRIIAGKLVLNLGPANLAEIIEAAVETIAPAALEKGVSITADVPPSELAIVADADRLQQVVWNLLSNAVKFTPRGGAVTVTAGHEGSSLWVRVDDTGEGIRPSALPLLFEPFRQADASTTRRHGGLGLGLAIVRQVVRAHGGAVEAASPGEGRGASFTVTLPARTVVPAIDPAPARASTGDARQAEDVPRLDDVRVLLVDDEEDALVVMTEILADLGASVKAVPSARQALEELPKTRPDVLVSDIGMPGMDGYSLIQQVRALPSERGGQTRAIALTAFARNEDAERALAAGFQMHIAKPVEIPRLAKAIAAFAAPTARSSTM